MQPSFAVTETHFLGGFLPIPGVLSLLAVSRALMFEGMMLLHHGDGVVMANERL